MPRKSKSKAQATLASAPANTAASSMILLCAGALIVAFFLPWVALLGATPSGFDLQRFFGGKALLLWSIPAFGAFTILAQGANSNPKNIAQLAGVLPFFALAYGFSLAGENLMRILTFGSYIGLLAGLFLFIAAGRLK